MLRSGSHFANKYLNLLNNGGPPLGTNATIFRNFLRLSTTLYDATPVRERDVVRQLIDRSTLHWRSFVTWRGLNSHSEQLWNGRFWREADIRRNTARRRHYDGAILAHLSLGRFVCTRGATQCSWRLTQDTHEALTHPLGICEANSARDRFKRLPAVLHHAAGGLYPQAFNGLGRGHPRRSDKSSPELPRAQVSDLGQIFDR
jgi:hypothetical protein